MTSNGLSKAMSLFINEIKDFLEQLPTILDRLKNDTNLSSEKTAQMCDIFHRIKGGAGFLGLEGIQAVAIDGENLFKTETSPTPKQLEDIITQLNTHYNRLINKL